MLIFTLAAKKLKSFKIIGGEMAVFIYEKDAFRKMVAVEGKEYSDNVLHHRGGFCSLFAFYQKWQELYTRYPKLVNGPEYLIIVEDNDMIYGLGGWNRYLVYNTGEIVFDAALAGSPKAIKRAKKQGFRILGSWSRF